VSDKKIITAGLKIESSMCALLDKLKIRPFSYKMGIKKVYDDGQIYEPSILDISPESIRRSFQVSILNLAAISLGSGFITKPATAHLLVNAFKNLAAITFETDYSFK
jgi:large subunit ribosomal protein LP0